MPSFTVYVATSPGYHHAGAFAEVALTLSAAFIDLGHPCLVTDDLDRVEGQVIVVGTNLVARDQSLRERIPPSAILYNLEQIEPGSPWCTPELLDLYASHRLFDYSHQNIVKLGELGINGARLLEIGYHSSLTRISPAQEDIDVLFYGSLNDRRARVLRTLQDDGLVVHHAFGSYGGERDALIARSRIVLNMHYFEARVFEIVRVSYLLANRRFVVSENGADIQLEAPFDRGLVFSAYDDLVTTVESFLESPGAREKVAQRGYELMTDRLQSELLEDALSEVMV